MYNDSPRARSSADTFLPSPILTSCHRAQSFSILIPTLFATSSKQVEWQKVAGQAIGAVDDDLELQVMRFCEIGTCREHGVSYRESDPSVYVHVRAKVWCTVAESRVCVLSLVIGWLGMDGRWMVCLVGYAGETRCSFVPSGFCRLLPDCIAGSVSCSLLRWVRRASA